MDYNELAGLVLAEILGRDASRPASVEEIVKLIKEYLDESNCCQ